MHIGESRKRNKSSAGWISFFYASLVILALVWVSVVYLPQQFNRLREDMNQTIEQKLTSHNSEFNQRLSSIEEKISQLGLLKDSVDLEKLQNQGQVLQLRLESLKNEIAAHKATIQNLTKTISDYEETIASLDWRKRQLDKAIKDAQNQLNQ